MNRESMQFAIGVVTLVSLLALAAIIIWFGEFQFVLQPRKTYYVLFKTAPGLEVKVPVRRAGIPIGEVREVTYDEQFGVVAATIVIEGQFTLREGDEPTLSRSFLGDTYLDIVTRPDMQGIANRPEYPEETTFQGRPPVDLVRTTEEAADLVPNADRAILEMERTASQWTGVGQRVNRLLDDNERQINNLTRQSEDAVERLNIALNNLNNTLDPKTQENFRVTMQNLRESSDDLRPVIEDSRKAIQQITATTQKLDEVAQNLQKTTKPMAERSERTMKNLDETAESMNHLMADLKLIVDQYQTQDGTLQRLMRDPSLYQRMDDAAFLLAKTLSELDGIMKDMKVFADKIARHPGELGVQGVFTRDAGLKNIPPSQMESQRRLPRN